MGKELPLARSEEEGQSVLLASGRTGTPQAESASGDKRKKISTTPKGYKGAEGKHTETASKSSKQTKGDTTRRTRRKRRRRDDKDRKQNRGDEGKDSRPRRSAQELGIEWTGSYCNEDDTTSRPQPHHWVEVDKLDRGAIFRCKFCKRYKWSPATVGDADNLGKLMRNYGDSEGYCRYLNRHRQAKIMLAKLQDIGKLEMQMKDKVKFAKEVARILSEKEYDRKWVITEED